MCAEQSRPLPFDTSGLRGSLRFDEPLSRHTSWRVGGPARYFYLPADREDVVELISRLPEDLSVTWIGLGSNLLARDGGVDGLVVKTSKALAELRLGEMAGEVYAEAGVSCAKLAKFTVRNGLAGAEFLAGVPGSFGGALAMNAGAFGGETWPLVSRIEWVDRSGDCHWIDRDDVPFSYRHVALPEGVSLLAGVLKLQPAAEDGDGAAEIRSLLERRGASQPIQSANAGSVFKNPQGHFAAKIIESLGLKGHAIGGARFSEVHANFIVNDGSATARDIEALIELAQRRASTEQGIQLEPEVRMIGGRHG